MIKQPVNEMDVSVKRLYAIAKSWTKVSVTYQDSYAGWLVSQRARELKDWCEDNITMGWPNGVAIFTLKVPTKHLYLR